MTINAASFIIEKADGRIEDGTVEVTLGRETRRLPAYRIGSRLTATGLGGRYATAAKVWPASITQHAAEESRPAFETARFGRDDRSLRFNKINGVFFR